MNLNTLNNSTPLSPRQLGTGIVLLGLVGVTAWGGWQVYTASVEEVETDISFTQEISTITALGRLEPEGEVINLTAPTSVQESRIEQLLVQEGDLVKPGQVIAILDNRAPLEATLQKAEQQVRVARARLSQVEAGAKMGELEAQRAEIARLRGEQKARVASQQATIARLAAELENARLEYERYDSLYQEGAVSASQRDTKRLVDTTAQQRLQEAKVELGRIQTTSQQQVQQAEAVLAQLAEVRPVDVETAQAEVEAAMATVTEAQAKLEQVYVRSRRGGQILKVYTHEGEKIADQGIAALGQTQEMLVVADVYQNDISQIQVGQTATMTSPVLSDPLRGKVERIGLQVEQQQVVNEDPAANIDAKVVEVYIRLDPASTQQVAGLTNLQVTATIQTQS